jgi:hypothetical protein
MIAVWIPLTIASSTGGGGVNTPSYFQMAQRQPAACFESTSQTRAIILPFL